MTSISVAAHAPDHPNLRPLSVFRDLPAVADLIELCFSHTMDYEGRQYVQDMRRAGSDHSFLTWASRMAESTSLPLSGYVWEEGGRIVGNTSLIPIRQRLQRMYLIANVAVHPDFRRRGIGRRLTRRALDHAREKRADSIWLQVRDDNPHAVELYRKLGFVERARRTTWQAAVMVSPPDPHSGFRVVPRHPRFWPAQRIWLERLHPEALSWHRKVNFASFRPGLWNRLVLFALDIDVRQWAAVRGNELQAVLSWYPSTRNEALFLAAPEQVNPQALTALLGQARRELDPLHPGLMMECPQSSLDGAIQAAGFRPIRTLIWMQATG